MDSTEFNRQAWDNIARSDSKLFQPVSNQQIEKARQGDWKIQLTAVKSVPDHWLHPVANKKILCLAGGGGHQGPILAAAGAIVTVFDFSQQQLEIDRRIASQHNLPVSTANGDIRDLGQFSDNSFHIVVNPCSVNFCSGIGQIWREAHRVLMPGGELLVGMINPVNYLFDAASLQRGRFVVRHRIPYCDRDLPPDEQKATIHETRPIEFGHTLTDLIGSQLEAGFVLIEMYEDRWGGDDILSDRIDTFIATRSRKRP